MKENKFVMGEEEETTTTKKKPARHHVKRRSSGKVHVTKLAPMARVHTDSEADVQQEERPLIRRSHSQRSLHRLDRKGFTSLTRRKSASSDKISFIITESNSSNPASLSSQMIAQPVEQTFNALANTLVIPKTKVYPTITPEKVMKKKQLIRSQFINQDIVKPPRTPTPPTIKNMSRTQQKLMLQKQQSQVEDETSPIHPRNMQKINKELETISKETKCIKRYQDPMKESLQRCLEKSILNNNRIGLANKHSISTFIVPTFHERPMIHQEQRQIAHRHHRLKTIASLHQEQQIIKEQKTTDTTPFWNKTAAFLDKVFHK